MRLSQIRYGPLNITILNSFLCCKAIVKYNSLNQNVHILELLIEYIVFLDYSAKRWNKFY